MIVSIENDKNYWKYKNKVKDKKTRFTIKEIFEDWWNKFCDKYENIKIRDVVIKNLDRMLKCKTKDAGFSLFKCPECGKEKFLFHTCKSRVCSSCGNKYNKQRENSIFSKLIRWKHRHVVFTIPEDLRRYFREDRKRLNLLFNAASITIKYWFKEKYKKDKLIPAYICVLHTFGRSLIFNPHIHVILLDGGISNKNKLFVKVDFFSYPSFRKRFMKVLLDMLENELGKKEFRVIKHNMYFRYKEGFYVYAPPSKFKSYVDLIKYVCRYVARPVMAESRIIDYDGVYVTFWYQRHEDDLFVVETIHIFEFIKRIIIHIPEYQFKTIRYYGFYSKKSKFHDKMVMLVHPKKIEFARKFNKWFLLSLKTFGDSPLICSKCKTVMQFQYRCTRWRLA